MSRGRNQVRIIGGQWKGRRVCFAPINQLRPTPDRVRETLFNWLMHDIGGARCLDAFAGSGALGFEALSRGAGFVVFLDQHNLVYRTLQSVLKELDVSHERAHVSKKDTLQWLNRMSVDPFDVIFLDPPFRRNMLQQTLSLIKIHGWLKPNGKLYIESESAPDEETLETMGWQVLRSKDCGEVYYTLLQQIL